MGFHIDGSGVRIGRVVLLNLALAVGQAAAADGFQGDVELLKLAAVQNQISVESIQTWRGTVTISEVRTEASGEERRYESTVDFAWDRGLNAKRWRWNCHDFRTVRAGVETPSEVGLMSGMLKDGAFYRLGPIPNSSRERRVVVIHGENRFSFGPESVDFDPLYCFTSMGEPLHQRFEGLYKLAKAGGAQTWTASRQGTLVSFVSHAEMPNGGRVLNHYDVDLGQGANVVAYNSSDPFGTLNYKYSFAEVAGCWVPVSYEYQHDSTERSTTYHRLARWTENVVNEPTDEKLFSLESLGVRDGDRIKDSRSGTQYTLGGTRGAEDAARARQGNLSIRPISGLMIANLIAVAAGVAYLVYSFIRHKPRKAD